MQQTARPSGAGFELLEWMGTPAPGPPVLLPEHPFCAVSYGLVPIKRKARIMDSEAGNADHGKMIRDT